MIFTIDLCTANGRSGTLNYLHQRIAGVFGNQDAIITIHGGTHRDEHRRLQALFRSDADVRVRVATDAAGEGVNLQCANLMVDYDLPWNPNRLDLRSVVFTAKSCAQTQSAEVDATASSKKSTGLTEVFLTSRSCAIGGTTGRTVL